MIKEAIAKLLERHDLSQPEAEAVMQEIMHGEATPSQIGGFLVALRMKGETTEEIAGCARAMRSHALKVTSKHKDLLDTCGSGGDVSHTFNISTIVALVAAGAGVRVAKHGNRAVSSRCGSADLLEALGVKIDLGPEAVARCIDEVGIGFLFAPHMHPAMKNAAGPRREMGIRTIFNILGPLTNPAGANHQLVGIYDAGLTDPLARVLGILGCHHAMVVHSNDGLDELSTVAPNQVSELKEGQVKTYTLDATSFGLPRAKKEDLKGGDTGFNVQVARNVLKGEKGPQRDAVLLNAAAALIAADKIGNFHSGLTLAAESIDSGKAAGKLEDLVQLSKSLS
ncbi:MAG: anthranilate phosphoribosyltransferase [Chloroflexi bacterium]|nr:anthranilate phosphoribosyltransferase [Chloroflexota bacterium]